MSFFNQAEVEQELRKEIVRLNEKLDMAKVESSIELKKQAAQHEIDMREKEFQLKHASDARVMEAEKNVHKMEIEMAQLKNENKMLREIVDINGDLVDIKQLVNKLIEKLPTVDLKNITVNSSKE